ncbi:GNAT family N-acetyltransferase [soil metagenome]
MVKCGEPTGEATPVGPVCSAAFAQLDVATLYAILQLRGEVFVVEQRCVYRELDGRDTEPTARHLWIATPTGAVCAYLRTLDESDGGTRIGRVVTAPAWRSRGLADRLVRHVLAEMSGPVVAEAQAHLRHWYEQRGFAVVGPGYDEDGITHVPMRWDPDAAGGTP